MGHKDDLLDGAKRCLYEKGYARTTARDIVAASGTNLASIGYHYGSKEALLNQALMSATEDFGEALDRLVATAPPAADPFERFEQIWERVIALYADHRPLWSATFESLSQLDHAEEVRAFFAGVQGLAHTGLSELWFGRAAEGEEVTDPARLRVGAFLQAILIGLMGQMLIDPAQAPTAKDLAAALRTMVES
ncbi:MAG TPA: TetR family transcriptional regulator [Baekduia sp.]|uniref:TetR/AcrR family transcriptional regulator n=1 Tax=Baekduia sp. TaxID=2600305 RepID=UPI002D767335|nr:TetR family transcriptional regulator [Baekduia sp.]HET6508948.1 TetR family transcriptional regulator [Baekduia sp.]